MRLTLFPRLWDFMNATQTAHSLLALPQGVSAPDPYAVLGLPPGESDNAKIAAALKSVVALLNGVKASADPAAWNQAAIWVKEARRVVSDPVLKAQLDQRIAGSTGNAAVGRPGATARSVNTAANFSTPPISPLQPASPSPVAPKFDPLAGLLPGQATAPQPTAGPAQPFPSQPIPANGRNTAFRAGNAPPPPQPPAVSPHPGFAQPPTIGENVGQSWSQGGVGGVAVETAHELEAIGKPNKLPGRRRRKRFPWASLILVGLTVASIGGMVALVVYLNKYPGGITIALQPGVGGATPVAGSDFAVAPPADRDDSPVDPVMGRLSPAKPARGTGRDSTGEAADDWLADLRQNVPPDGDAPMATENPAMAPENPAMIALPDAMPDAAALTDPSMANIPEGNAPPTEVPNMAAIPGVTEPTPEQLEAAQAALLKAREVLAGAQWDQMNAAAEAAAKAAATEEQKQMAEQLVQLAELATYYHIGVEKALNELKSSETFNVTEKLEVSVVEITPAKVTLRFNGRNKDYARSELPLVVAHKVAGFTMPVDEPATKTAAQVYQALAPVTTPQYREQAIKTLEAMPPRPDDVDPAELVAAIRQVFPE